MSGPEWETVDIGDDGERHPVLRLNFATSGLEAAFTVCKLASEVVVKYGVQEDVLLSADPVRASVALHIYKTGGLQDTHRAAAREISVRLREL